MKKTLVSLVAMMFFSVPFAFGLSINDDYYLGAIYPATPANEVNEAILINNLIEIGSGQDASEVDASRTYVPYGSFTLDYPDATAVGSYKPAGSSNIGDFGSGYTYLMGKYAQTGHVWYVAGLTGEFSIPAEVSDLNNNNNSGGDLSHYTLFNPAPTQVPEPTTLLLFGAGIAGLAMYRRKKS